VTHVNDVGHVFAFSGKTDDAAATSASVIRVAPIVIPG
jgi:hypothetical protein